MSVSSIDGSPVPTDLQTKYQKLATEYAKMRAQVSVLKKAVLEEQSKNSEILETNKIKDLALRKSEQEMDSLNFRNLQLTKRVTVLQEELDLLQNKKKSKVKGNASQPVEEVRSRVFDEELMNKIVENAQLINQVEDQQERFNREKFELTNRIEIYEHDLEILNKSINTINESHKSEINKKENENKMLIQLVKAKEEEIVKLKTEVRKIYDIKSSEKIYYQSVLINLRDEIVRQNFVKMISSVPLVTILDCVSTFYCLFCQDIILSTDEAKIIKYVGLIQNLKETYNMFLSHLGLKNFENYFETDLQQLHHDLSSFLHAQFEMSEFITVTVNGIKSIIDIPEDIFIRQTKVWQKLICLFKFCGTDTTCIVQHGIQLLLSLQEDFGKLLINFKTKIDIKNQETFLDTFDKIKVNISELVKLLKENAKMIEDVLIIQKTASRSIEPQADREYWKQELDLLKMSHSKKVKDLEEQIASLSGATTPQSTGSANVAMSPTQPLPSTNEFGSLSTPLVLTLESEGYDCQVKKYFTSRTNSLVSDRQSAESKCTSLISECELLKKRLEHSSESNMVLEASLQQAHDTVNRLQEELTTTSSNYETQLSSISEHIVNMNDKVASQQEHIEELTYLLENKDKRGKQK